MRIKMCNKINNSQNLRARQIVRILFYAALPKTGIKKKLTVSSIGTVKLGADVFVNLKQGSIQKYYTTGEVLG